MIHYGSDDGMLGVYGDPFTEAVESDDVEIIIPTQILWIAPDGNNVYAKFKTRYVSRSTYAGMVRDITMDVSNIPY